MRQIAATGVPVSVEEASFFLGRVTVLASGKRELAGWRKRLFSILHYTAQPATGYFGSHPAERSSSACRSRSRRAGSRPSSAIASEKSASARAPPRGARRLAARACAAARDGYQQRETSEPGTPPARRARPRGDDAKPAHTRDQRQSRGTMNARSADWKRAITGSIASRATPGSVIS